MYDLKQSLRFVGIPVSRPFIDVTINKKTVPGLMDTGSTQSRIDETIARFVLNLSVFRNPEVVIPEVVKVTVRRGETEIPLRCKVEQLEPGVHLMLGMDFFYFFPFDMTITNIEINSRKFWKNQHHRVVGYVYNHKRGRILRHKLESIGYGEFQKDFLRSY